MQGQITITLDPTDSVQVQAALALFQKLSGEAVAPQTLGTPLCVPLGKVELSEEPLCKTVTRTAKATKVSELKAEATVAEIKHEEVKAIVAEEVSKVLEEAKAEPTVKIEELRALLSKKVQEHREVIKKKLTEYGAGSISLLKTEFYQEMHTFLTSLK